MSTLPEYLRDFSCFRDLSEEQLNAVAEFSNAVCYPPNHILFREGEKGKNLYFLVKGVVEVLYNMGSDDQVRVEMITDEEIAGCSALAEPYTYNASERSLTEIEVLEIDILSFQELMKNNCQLGLKIYQHIIKVLMNRIHELRMVSSMK